MHKLNKCCQDTVKEVVGKIETARNWTAPDCEDPFLVEQGYDLALHDLTNQLRSEYGIKDE